MIEGLLLLIIGIGALGAFVVGVALLVMWYRAGQHQDSREAVIYGNLVQCPNCEWMNPLDTAVCLKCHAPLVLPSSYRPVVTPSYVEVIPAPAPIQGPAGYVPPAGATVRSPYAPPVPQPGMSDHTMPAGAVAAPPPGRPPAAAQPAAFSQPSASPAQTVIAARGAGQTAAPVNTAADTAASEAWLEVTAGVSKGQRYPLSQSDTLFGRSTKCDVQLPDQKVSRKHFVVRYAQGGYFLQDQGSTSGTLINGEPVEARRLADGDRIDLGDTTLVFHQRQQQG